MKAVIFDAFGTLVRISDASHPYRKILGHGANQGRLPKPDDARCIMTSPLGLQEAAERLSIRMPHNAMRAVEKALEAELESIEAYPDGIAAVRLFQAAGYKVGVCSNLALPYASAIERHYPFLDAYSYSFEVGATKPEPEIYLDACRKLGCLPREAIMIGDSQRCDRDGPIELGISGHYLSRSSSGGFSNLIDFAKAMLGQRSGSE